jgi:hypothetical protein
MNNEWFFYIFNFDVVFFMHLWSTFILSLEKTNHSIIKNVVIQSHNITWDCELVILMNKKCSSTQLAYELAQYGSTSFAHKHIFLIIKKN